MGHAVARAAKLMGAEVILISGPTAIPDPTDFTTISVKTAEQMLKAAQSHASQADWIIGLAAVADYRVANPSATKLRRSAQDITLALTPNPDIIATLAAENSNKKVIAFAAEPSDDPSVAAEKMHRKGVAAIALNDISNPEIGFQSDENELTLIFADGSTSHSGRLSKLACGLWLLDQIARH
jgi:phosphopantothenoylcysteine decarboxylase/phosphopantothenate--cysteine ligase